MLHGRPARGVGVGAMPLDESTRRFAFLLQRDVRRLAERLSERTGRGEQMRADSSSRVVTWVSHNGEVIARQFAEVLATYDTRDRILRWGWAGRASSASPSHGDTIVREAQARGVPQLAMSVVADLDLEEAEELGRLGAILARAEAYASRPGVGHEVELVGLFDRAQPDAPDRLSVPPPPVQPAAGPGRSSTPPPPYRSLPPVREVYAPRAPHADGSTNRPSPTPPPPRVPTSPPPVARVSSSPPPEVRGLVREPRREHFVPAANAAVRALARACPGYQQGLFAVTVTTTPGRPEAARRVGVQLVAVDAAGNLVALDPPRDLVEAAVEMTEADRHDAGGVWRKLSARILPKADGGATLQVDVV